MGTRWECVREPKARTRPCRARVENPDTSDRRFAKSSSAGLHHIPSLQLTLGLWLQGSVGLRNQVRLAVVNDRTVRARVGVVLPSQVVGGNLQPNVARDKSFFPRIRAWALRSVTTITGSRSNDMSSTKVLDIISASGRTSCAVRQQRVRKLGHEFRSPPHRTETGRASGRVGLEVGMTPEHDDPAGR
jgi:hypothetical protein